MADAEGAVRMTAPAFAGFALATAGGDTVRARAIVPIDPASFWARVRDALVQVEIEEAPLSAAGGHGR